MEASLVKAVAHCDQTLTMSHCLYLCYINDLFSLYTSRRRGSAKCLSKRFFFSQAKADNFRNMKYIAKIKIVLRSVLTFYQNHFTASGSPVDFKVTAGTT